MNTLTLEEVIWYSVPVKLSEGRINPFQGVGVE